MQRVALLLLALPELGLTFRTGREGGGAKYGKSMMNEHRNESHHLLNAAGTPMTKPLSCTSLARLTLFPGEPSTRSTSGRRSPALTEGGRVAWNGRDPQRAARRVVWRADARAPDCSISGQRIVF